MQTITAKLNKKGDKAYINIDELLAITYGDDFKKIDTGKTFKGYKVYDYQINKFFGSEYGNWMNADTKIIRSVKRDSYIYFTVVNGEINFDKGFTSAFPNAKKQGMVIVDEIAEKLDNINVELA